MRPLWLALCLLAGAAQAGDFELGRQYRHGDGVRRDTTRAFALIERAAIKGQPAAMFTLSNMLEAGEGTAVNRAAAHQWLEAAAELEYPQALQQLALNLQDGLMGYETDPARSAQLLREAEHALKHRH